MADVLRRYLAQRHPVASLSHTSGELLNAVRGVTTVPFERLRLLLGEIEPVKFAAAPLTLERARDLGAEARAIVREEHERAAALASAPREKAA